MREQEFINEITHMQFVEHKWILILPCVLMLTDIITGILHAWSNNDIKSSKMRGGLLKKCGEIIVILLGELFSVSMGLPKEIEQGLALYIIVMELISILENLGNLGVPIPNFLKRSLKEVSEKINGGSEEDGESQSNKSD